MIVEELKLNSLSEMLQFLAYEYRFGDQGKQQRAFHAINSIVDGLADNEVEAHDALTLHAIGLAVIRDLGNHPSIPEELKPALRFLSHIFQATAGPLEWFSEKPLSECRYLEEPVHTTMQ